MPIKTRDPHSLSDDDYIQMGEAVVLWCGEHHADPDHAPMDTDYEPKLLAFSLKLQQYRNAQEQAEDRHKEVKGPGDELHSLMIGLNRIIPTVFDGDESMLGYFSLALPIPTDLDLLLVDARACRDYWDSLCDPDVPPEYAAVAFLLDQVAGKITALEDAREAWTLASQKVDKLQNEKLVSREEAHHVERLIFNWYRALHTDSHDGWWTGTPWGAAWGEGSGDGETPENWDDILTGFTVKEGPPGDANVSVNLHPDADGIRIYVAEGPLGDDNQPEKPSEPVEPQVPQPYFLPISAGVRSWIWICAVKDGVEGPISGPLWIEPTL